MNAELIVALDVPSADDIPTILDRLPTDIVWFKIGLEIFSAEGPKALAALSQRHRKIFLDLKLHDIPRTVARAVSAACRLGVSMMTVHASGGRDMLKAASDAAREFGPCAPKLVSVTTLTSLNERDLREIGIARSLADHTLALGEMAISAGVDGLVCSTLEAAAFRARLGPSPILVTPGIRPAGSDLGDQKRVATPEIAVRAGASFLVVGRPILDAPDMATAAMEIIRQIKAAR